MVRPERFGVPPNSRKSRGGVPPTLKTIQGELWCALRDSEFPLTQEKVAARYHSLRPGPTAFGQHCFQPMHTTNKIEPQPPDRTPLAHVRARHSYCTAAC